MQQVQPKAVLKHQTGIVQRGDGKVVLLLDLDCVSQEIDSIESRGKVFDLSSWLQNWLDQAHDCVEAAFISSLNPDYYESLR